MQEEYSGVSVFRYLLWLSYCCDDEMKIHGSGDEKIRGLYLPHPVIIHSAINIPPPSPAGEGRTIRRNERIVCWGEVKGDRETNH